MLRAACGIALGYVVMVFFVSATLSLSFLALGADRSFRPGTYEVSKIWAFLTILFILGAAIVGGFLCASVGRSRTAPIVLAALVLVIGIVGALLLPPSGDLGPQPRPGNVGHFEAIQNASRPPWTAWLDPFLAAAGILAGAHLWERSAARTPA